jgi:hypothetical protein
VSLGIPFHLKKKLGVVASFSGADMQKPYAPKYEQGKTKIDLFREFFTKIIYVQVMNFIPVKVSTLYASYYCVVKTPTHSRHYSGRSN